jgi:hypothetical protein
MSLQLNSPAFSRNGEIPAEHTCDGPGAPPPLEWSGAPEGTKTFALIVDDPDAPDPKAPKRTYVHWVAYDIPSVATCPEGHGRRDGMNDEGLRGYAAACPPTGRHRYVFKLYALDAKLGDLGSATKTDLEQAMKGHVLETAELVGTYERKRAG